MTSVISALAVAATLLQGPPVNQACSALTPDQLSSLIGTPERTVPITATTSGSTCMFQNSEKTITVQMATPSTADAAQGLFDAKKRIASGSDVAGWGVPAYAGAMQQVVVVGVLVKQTLTEVKVLDKSQQPDAMTAKLKAVMKAVAARTK